MGLEEERGVVVVRGVEAHVGDERRAGGADGDLELSVETDHLAAGRGGVFADGKVGVRLDEDERRPLLAVVGVDISRRIRQVHRSIPGRS